MSAYFLESAPPEAEWVHKDGVDQPFVIDPHTGERRFLTWIPAADDHPVRSKLKSWKDAGKPVIPEAQWVEFDDTYAQVPILNQDGYGACNPHAWATAMMISRCQQGAPFVNLSPWFLYSLINGGRDAGSDPGEAMTALMTTGICPVDDVPYGTLGPPGYSSQAKTDAARYLLLEAYLLESREEIASAIQMRYAVTTDVRAGNFYATDSSGVIGFRRGMTNHEVFLGEGMRKVNGVWQYKSRNSWDVTWGLKGWGYQTDDHLNAAQQPHAIKIAVVHGDEPGMPPKAKAA